MPHTATEAPGVSCLLELYSGIGGMRTALHEIGLTPDKCFPYEIHPTALTVYHHNFPSGASKPAPHNLNGLTAAKWEAMKPSLLTLSPPCQPYTRQGKQLGEMDARNDSLERVISLLSEVSHLPQHLLLENVRGFEGGASCRRLLAVLRARGFSCEEYLLSPKQLGVPNSRMRYYLLARRRETLEPVLDKEVQGLQLKFPMCVCLPNVQQSSVNGANVPQKSSEDSSNVPECSVDLAKVPQRSSIASANVPKLSLVDLEKNPQQFSVDIPEKSSVLLENKVLRCKDCGQVVDDGTTKALLEHFSTANCTEDFSTVNCTEDFSTVNCSERIYDRTEAIAGSKADAIKSSRDTIKDGSVMDVRSNLQAVNHLGSNRNVNLGLYLSRIDREYSIGEYALKNKDLLRYVYLLDIVDDYSEKSCCFTKNYSRLLEGAGSVYNPSGRIEMQKVFRKVDALQSRKSLLMNPPTADSENSNAEYPKKRTLSDPPNEPDLEKTNDNASSDLKNINAAIIQCHDEKSNDDILRASDLEKINSEIVREVTSLRLRFFSPTEVLALMGFPAWFRFPAQVSAKACYKLVGNSVNVLVVKLLLRRLLRG